LNILVGYTGQISLGTAAFMGVGAYSCYKLTSYFPDVNIIILIFASGFFAAAVGALFGLPSLRIKGFYLVVATLAAQFFLEWCFIRIGWLYNFNPSGAIEVPQREAFGFIVTGASAEPVTRYLVVLTILIFLTVIAGNLVRGRIGRSWMMIRDMDIAAELIGVRPLATKLSAFAVSSYYCGVSGALMVFMWLGAAEVESFDVNHSFLYLFMVILGGLGSITGSYMGAAFIWTFPLVLKEIGKIFEINPTVMENVSLVAIGVMIVFILIKEPHGLARLWQLGKQKLRIWPFPH
jgi:branched-chain amino acid transport system permease protein